MPISTVPFTEIHIAEAARLLAKRHQEDRHTEALLPERFTEAAVAQEAIAKTWKAQLACGVVALQDGDMVGYLLSAPKISDIWGRSYWIPLAGHAIDRQRVDAELYRDMYAALSERWIKAGCFHHYILLPASDTAALEAWFALSFGKEQAHGVREITALPAVTRKPEAALEIVRATPDDLEEVLEVGNIISEYQARSPVYGAFLPEARAERRADYEELLSDPDVVIWLGRQEGKVLGFQCYYTAQSGPDSLFVPENSIELALSATRAEARGQGIGQTLTAYGLQWAQEQGYTTSIADWRVTNLLSSRFWPRQGFRPVAYRLSRHIDERVTWAR